MTHHFSIALGLAALTVLAGCEGTKPYVRSPDTVIASDSDGGVDGGKLPDGVGAVAYDPDGCQVWIVDDGLEGYASRRFDPETGLPVCDGRYPPGTVIGDHQTAKAGITDFVPRRRNRD